MKHAFSAETLHRLWSRLSAVLLAAAAVTCAGLFATNQASALYILTGSTDSAIVLDGTVKEETLKDLSSQCIYMGTGTGGFQITLQKDTAFTIRWNGSIISGISRKETVSSLLNRFHVEPGPLDIVLVDLSEDGAVTMTVDSEFTYYDRCSEIVAYETERIPTPSLPEGTEVVEQAGRNGVRTAVYEVVYSGGELVSRQLVDEEDSTAVTQRILVGTGRKDSLGDNGDRITAVSKNGDGSGVLTLQSGTTLNFTAAKSMTATAYTSGYDGVGYRTASGTAVQVGTVAVDKSVIPLGTRLYIVSDDGKVVYGMAVAEDTGVHGNRIDLYYETYEQCISFGRRSCTVYILE